MDQLTAVEIAEWEAYDRISPIGEEREDIRMAMLSSVITNCFIGALNGKKGKFTSPMDFIPDWTGERQETKKQTPEQMKEMFLAIAKDRDKNNKSKTRIKKEKNG